MIRRPPRSTLFPYTTALPISRAATMFATTGRVRWRPRDDGASAARQHSGPPQRLQRDGERTRSEEHTSELQSRQYLVCRLLLEKKKNNTRPNFHPPYHYPLQQ